MKKTVFWVLMILCAACTKTDPVKEILDGYEGEYELVSIKLTGYAAPVDLDNDGFAHGDDLILVEYKGLTNYKKESSSFHSNHIHTRSGDLSISIPSQEILAEGDAPYSASSPIYIAAAKQYMTLLFTADLVIDDNLSEIWSAGPYNVSDNDHNINRSLASGLEIVSASKEIIVVKLGNAVFYDFKTGSLIQSGAEYTFKHV